MAMGTGSGARADKLYHGSTDIEQTVTGGIQLPYSGGGTGNQIAIVALVLGIVAGVGGFLLYDFVQCVGVIGNLCIGPSRPYETPGLVVMIFGGILFVVGIIFLTIPGGRGIQAGMPSPQALSPPPPSVPPPVAPPIEPQVGAVEDNQKEGGPGKWTPRKTVLVLLIAAAIITGSIIGGIFAFQALNQPHILVRNFDASLGSCGFFSPNQSVLVNSFHLVNTGPAAGYVDVAVTVDGNVVRTYTFLVLSGEDRSFDPSEDALHSFSPSDWTISLQGCSSQVVSYVVGNVWKASVMCPEAGVGADV